MKANQEVKIITRELFSAVSKQDLRKIRAMAGAGLSVDSPDKEGWTPLLRAAARNKTEAALVLVELGANINARVPKKDHDDILRDASVLMVCAEKGNADLVDNLLSKGADLEVTQHSGWTALVFAATRGHSGVVKRLIAAGASVPSSTWGWVLGQPANTGRVELLELLVECAEAKPEALGDYLVSAAAHGQLGSVKALLNRGVDINHVNPQRHRNALIEAVVWKRFDIVEYLLRCGADETMVVRNDTALRAAKRVRAYRAVTLVKNAAKLRTVAGVAVRPASQPPISGARVKASQEIKKVTVKAKPTAKRGAGQPENGMRHSNAVGGTADFVGFVSDGQPEWVLLAVKASFATTMEQFTQTLGIKVAHGSLPCSTPESEEPVWPGGVLVQLRNHTWTVWLQSVFATAGLETVSEQARALSEAIGTRVVTFVAQDTAGVQAYELFDRGQLAERAEWEIGCSPHSFDSERGRKKKAKQSGEALVEDVFRELNLYLPACYPAERKGKPCLVMVKPEPSAVANAALIST